MRKYLVFWPYLVGLLLLSVLLWRFLRRYRPSRQSLDRVDLTKLISAIVRNSKYSNLRDYIISQARFETADYTSKVLKENNNLFGMRLPKERQTLAVGEKNGFAVYKSLDDSINDLFLYFQAKKFPKIVLSLPLYVTRLKERGYFTVDSNTYYNGLLKYYKQ